MRLESGFMFVRRAMLFGLVLALVAGPAGGASGAGSVFIEGLGDVPLMPGLSVIEDAGVRFDAPGGRIVEVVAVGQVTANAVNAFYDETLPQLGWRIGGAEFRREGEALRLEFSKGEGGLAVRFLLTPRN